MKTLLKLVICLSVLVFLTGSITAQEVTQSSDVLKVKIEEFEKADIASKSAAVQSIYQRTLLRLYNDFNSALTREIAELKKIQAAQSGTTDRELQKDTAALLQRLATEQSITSEKIKTLDDVRTTVTQVRSVPEPTPFVVPDKPKPGATVPTVAVITGRVTTINEQIFTNAYEFTPEQIRGAVQQVISNRTPAGFQAPDDPNLPEIRIQETQELVKAHAGPNPPPPPGGTLLLKRDHAGALDTPLTEVELEVTNPNNSAFKKKYLTGYDGTYNIPVADLPDGAYVFSVKMGQFKTSIPVLMNGGVPSPATPDLQLLVRPLGEFSRAIVGFEQAGASAAKADQNYFLDLTLSHPLPFQKSVHPYFGPRGRMWGTVRVTSVPQSISSPVGTFVSNFAQQVSEIKVNEVAQGVEFLAGVDLRLTNKFLSFGSFGGQTATKLTLSFIAGGGAITPFTPRETLEVFKAFPGAPGLPPLPAGTEFVAFVSPDRDRFFRQYYAGLRLQTHYFDYKNRDIPLNRYPAQLDITFGQNEAITGGRLHGGVLRLEGFYPLPYNELSFVHLFGTALIRPIGSKITDPLILEPASPLPTLPAANVFLITVPQINRDYYRVGFGFDLIELVKKFGAGVSR
jgi:hypothetical protein